MAYLENCEEIYLSDTSDVYYVADTRDGFEDNSLKEELEGQEKDSSSLLEFRYIYALDEICQE